MKVIKIKITTEYTKVWYSAKRFKTKKEAVEKAIFHLKSMIEKGLI